MDQSAAIDIARQGMSVALMVALPIMVVTLFIGVLVSVFQAITQVQEMTLTFVPKLIGVAISMALLGGWMLTSLVSFTRVCFEHIAQVGS